MTMNEISANNKLVCIDIYIVKVDGKTELHINKNRYCKYPVAVLIKAWGEREFGKRFYIKKNHKAGYSVYTNQPIFYVNGERKDISFTYSISGEFEYRWLLINGKKELSVRTASGIAEIFRSYPAVIGERLFPFTVDLVANKKGLKLRVL